MNTQNMNPGELVEWAVAIALSLFVLSGGVQCVMDQLGVSLDASMQESRGTPDVP